MRPLPLAPEATDRMAGTRKQRTRPRILVVDSGNGLALPHGPFDPAAHASLEDGFRQLIEAQAGLDLYYVDNWSLAHDVWKTSAVTTSFITLAMMSVVGSLPGER